VEIPGYGRDKLNAAYAYGYSAVDDTMPEADKQAAGAQLLVQTIHGLTGLQVDHYAEVDLLGFFELTSVVGGVRVNLCEAVDDREYSGAYFPAGPQTISGADALKFVGSGTTWAPRAAATTTGSSASRSSWPAYCATCCPRTCSWTWASSVSSSRPPRRP
jgi:LCP family protein required for cell wall assembly